MPNPLCLCFSQAAILIFFPAAAWTGVVPAWFVSIRIMAIYIVFFLIISILSHPNSFLRYFSINSFAFLLFFSLLKYNAQYQHFLSGAASLIWRSISYLAQHFLYFFPLPQGQGSFLPTFLKITSSSLSIGMPVTRGTSSLKISDISFAV